VGGGGGGGRLRNSYLYENSFSMVKDKPPPLWKKFPDPERLNHFIQ